MRVRVIAALAATILWCGPALAVTKLAAEPEVAKDLTQAAPEVAAPASVLDRVSLLAGRLPEPTSWALMILGFGGAGAALRLRRRQSVQNGRQA